MSEIELKFGVPPARAGTIDAALRRAHARREAIESRYFDTPDHRLAEAGLSLRLRRSAGLWEQTLKAPAASLGERLEETVLRPGRWGPGGPPVDLALHDSTTAGKRLRQVLQQDGRAEVGLEPVHVCTVTRRSIEIDAHGGRVEVAYDRGEIHAGAALGAGVRGRVRAQGRRRRRPGRLRQERRSRAGAVAQHVVEGGPRRPGGARRNRGPAGEGQAAGARSRHDAARRSFAPCSRLVSIRCWRTRPRSPRDTGPPNRSTSCGSGSAAPAPPGASSRRSALQPPPTGRRRWPRPFAPSAPTAIATPWSRRCRRGWPNRARPSRRCRLKGASRRTRSRSSGPLPSSAPCSMPWP